MKSVIVITMVLALIYYVEMGETASWYPEDPNRIKNLTEARTTHFLKIYNSSLGTMNEELASMRTKQDKFVNQTVDATIINIQKYAADNNKAGNKKAEDCIDLARKHLENATTMFSNSFDNLVKIQQNHMEIEIYEPIIKEGKSIVAELNKIISPINRIKSPKKAIRAAAKKYNNFRDKRSWKKKSMSKRRAKTISEVSNEVNELKIILTNGVGVIKVEAKECINEVGNIKR